MPLRTLFLTATLLISFSTSVWAEKPILEVQQVTDNIYAIVGPTTNRDTENLGNNATFGLLVTDEGAVLVDAGGSYKGAHMLHEAIKSITDKPVKIVINSGGQDHRWIGNSYFKQQGARLIASSAAVEDQKARTTDQLLGLSSLIGDAGYEGTDTVYAEETFDGTLTLEFGGETVELHHVGAAHTPGDAYIWIPSQKVLFSGDIIYVQRMLGVGSMSNSSSWVEVFDSIAALNPEHIIPGHGPVTTLERASKETYHYLQFLRDVVRQFIDDGETMDAISKIDQTAFSFLQNYETLKGRNAQQVFSELEWE